MQVQGLSFVVLLSTLSTVLTEEALSDKERERIMEAYCLKIEDFVTPMKELDILGSWLSLRPTKDFPCLGQSDIDVATAETKEFWRERCSTYNEAVDIDDYDYAMTNNNNTEIPFRMLSSRGAKGSMLGAKCEVLSLDYRKHGKFKAMILMGFGTCEHPVPLAIYGPNKAKTRCVTGYEDFNVENRKAKRYLTFFC